MSGATWFPESPIGSGLGRSTLIHSLTRHAHIESRVRPKQLKQLSLCRRSNFVNRTRVECLISLLVEKSIGLLVVLRERFMGPALQVKANSASVVPNGTFTSFSGAPTTPEAGTFLLLGRVLLGISYGARRRWLK